MCDEIITSMINCVKYFTTQTSPFMNFFINHIIHMTLVLDTMKSISILMNTYDIV